MTTPDLTADELVRVTAFGLDKPETTDRAVRDGDGRN